MSLLKRLVTSLCTPGSARAKGGYLFSTDWFSFNIPALTALLKGHVGAAPAILEIGSFEGASTVWMLENAFGDGSAGRMCCIDTWQGGEEHDHSAMPLVEARFDHNVALARRRFAPGVRFEKLKGTSQAELAALLARDRAGSFDLAYIDGSHQAPDVLGDLVMCFPLLKVGGVFACDDYHWREHPDPLHQPKMGIDAFCAVFAHKLRMLDGMSDYQKYFIKIRD